LNTDQQAHAGDDGRRGTCSRCRYFSALTTECRKNAIRIAGMATNPSGQPMFVSSFPATQPQNWCGEFAADLALVPRG
jgi:hypothetical protein